MENIDEETLEKDPAVRAEIHEARTAYKAGDYQNLDEYIKKHQRK